MQQVLNEHNKKTFNKTSVVRLFVRRRLHAMTKECYSADQREVMAVSGTFINYSNAFPFGNPGSRFATVLATNISPCTLALFFSQFGGLNTLPMI